jgi:hypothetical protein
MRLRLLVPLVLSLFLLPAISPAAPSKRWPSVEEQLARAHVIPGSALEKLIRANQDVSVLAPWEADDDEIGIPLWLRVLWRKAHPDSLEMAEDSSGGYPLVLKEQYAWLVSHQNLRRGKPEPSTPPAKRLTAGDNVRISGLAPEIARAESDIRVFPHNINVIIAACNNNTGSGGQTQIYSTDGGRTWAQTTLPLIASDVFHSDPAVDFTSDGTAWSLTIGVEHAAQSLRVRAYRSEKDAQGNNDYSRWVPAGTPSGSQTTADKGLMWIDHNATSPFRNTIYAIWYALLPDRSRPTFVSRRPPGLSSSWSAPVQVSGVETRGSSAGGDIKTNANGEVFAFWPSSSPSSEETRKIYLAKSTDGGATFSLPIEVAPTFGSYQIGVPAFNGSVAHRPLIYPSGGTYRTSTKNLVYAAWMDLNQDECSAPCPSPGSCPNPSLSCKTRIWFSRSTDGGSTWEPKRMLMNQPNANDQFNPRLNVDEATGELTVIYYDTILDPNRVQTHVFAQRSTTDGASWDNPVQVTTVASDETNGTLGIQYGDYNGIAGYAGVVFPSWTDHRNSIEEIWTARLTNQSLDPPASLTATAAGTSHVNLTWTASPGATSYQVQRRSDGGAFQLVATPTTPSYTDSTVAANKTYVYRVLAVSSSQTSAPSAPDLATTLLFTDDPVAAGGIVKKIHLTELRQAVNLVRAAAGQGAFPFTDTTPTGIKAIHIRELRSALDQARGTIGVTMRTYSDPTLTPQSTLVRAAHFQELRMGVK